MMGRETRDYFIIDQWKIAQKEMDFDLYLWSHLKQKFKYRFAHSYPSTLTRGRFGSYTSVTPNDSPNKDDKDIFGIVKRRIEYCARCKQGSFSVSSKEWTKFIKSFMADAAKDINSQFAAHVARLDDKNEYNAKLYDELEKKLKQRHIQIASDSISIIIGKIIDCLKNLRNPQMLADLKSLNTGTQREFIKVDKSFWGKATSAYNWGSASYHHVMGGAGKYGGAVLDMGQNFVHGQG